MLLTFLVALLFSACNQPEIKAGSICTIDDGEGKIGIVKVLVINLEEAHVKLYKNKFEKRPDQVDIKTLDAGSGKDGYGIGHMPMDRNIFDNWEPAAIGFEEVTKEELAEYELWKKR